MTKAKIITQKNQLTTNLIEELRTTYKEYFTKREFEVLMLNIVYGWTLVDVSNSLHISKRRVMQLKRNAAKKLKRVVNERQYK